MGNSNSNAAKKRQEEEEENDKLYKRAVKLYHYRLKNYNPMIHGYYSNYLHNIQAQFELDCIPDYLRRGANSTPKRYCDYDYY